MKPCIMCSVQTDKRTVDNIAICKYCAEDEGMLYCDRCKKYIPSSRHCKCQEIYYDHV